MSELRYSLNKFKITLNKIFTEEPRFVPLEAVKKVAEALDAEITKKDTTFNQWTVNEILGKLKHGEGLTKKECRELPFVIVDKDCGNETLDKCKEYLKAPAKRILRRLIFVYFMNYMSIDYTKKKFLSECIVNGLNEVQIDTTNTFMLTMKNSVNEIFSQGSLRNISGMIDTFGLIGCTKKLELPEQIRFSELIVESTRVYFEETKNSLSQKVGVLKEIMKSYEQFQNVFPYIADVMIKSINKSGAGAEYEYRNYCVDVFYDVLGDPRYTRYAVKWNAVSDESRRIFLSWIAERDLELFFEIIDRTGVDRMWSPRKAFWRRYLPYISNTWVVFGREAMWHARQVTNGKLSYGELKGGESKHSAFAFKIGKYVFVEWSHNGSLRVWEENMAPRIFGLKGIYTDDMKNSISSVYTKSHHGNWQAEVRYWISNHCRVYPEK